MRGAYYSSSVSLPDIYLPNSFKPSEALWSTPKQFPSISRVLSHCLGAMEKILVKVTLLGTKMISTSAKEGAPAPEDTMA